MMLGGNKTSALQGVIVFGILLIPFVVEFHHVISYTCVTTSHFITLDSCPLNLKHTVILLRRALFFVHKYFLSLSSLQFPIKDLLCKKCIWSPYCPRS